MRDLLTQLINKLFQMGYVSRLEFQDKEVEVWFIMQKGKLIYYISAYPEQIIIQRKNMGAEGTFSFNTNSNESLSLMIKFVKSFSKLWN